MDEAFVADALTHRRITTYLHRLADIIPDLQVLLQALPAHCDPTVFYTRVRPWFRGTDSDPSRPWVFEGLDALPDFPEPTELSGPSAPTHTPDIFLGIDSAAPAPSTDKQPFLACMRAYMPRHHRAFLQHLAANPRPLRALLLAAADPALLDTYNATVRALKHFRDAHFRTVALYIIGPASHAAPTTDNSTATPLIIGTGGTYLATFLKDVRDRTEDALISVPTAQMD
jgi:indoleamine 2,3-dioxygenase